MDNMKLKDIMEYIDGNCIINVEDATDDEFDYVDDFMSSDTIKMNEYQDAQVTTIMPYDEDCILINVSINCGLYTENQSINYE